MEDNAPSPVAESDAPKTFWLKISGDGHYKLYLDGTFITEGPAPAWHTHYYYNEERLEKLPGGKYVPGGHLCVAVPFRGKRIRVVKEQGSVRVEKRQKERKEDRMGQRQEWLGALIKIAGPVLDALEGGNLKKEMPLAFHEDRAVYASLEAFGRTMMGMAPWLEADVDEEGEEYLQQKKYKEKVLRCFAMATDPDSPDFMNFCKGDQPLVDAAFLAHALVRAPEKLAGALGEDVRSNLVKALISSRQIIPCNSNWIFFSAMVEAGLHVLGEPCDMTRVIYALRTFQEWYKGDGVYGDGRMFHWDYYNSFVIQPMYVDLVDLFYQGNEEIAAMRGDVLARASRYASQLERMIGPDGSYPVIGRSICYRFGVFHLLAQSALQHRLENSLSPAAVRCGLGAVIKRVMSAAGMFDSKGWLLPGVYGHQPELAENYIGTGSLYLCSTVFLPLGLPADDPFWTMPDEDWSGRKVWTGGHIMIDHALD